MESSQTTNERFFHYFQHEVADLQEQIERISGHSLSGGEVKDAIEHCSAGIARLSNEIRDILATLPAYDRQTYADAIKALSAKLQAVRAQVNRKQKFTFKNSLFKIAKNESAVSIHEAAGLASRQGYEPPGSQNGSTTSSMITSPLDAGTPNPEVADGALTKRSNEHIVYTGIDNTLALMTDITGCIVDLSGAPEAFPIFRLRNISRSVIILPSVTGPIYADGLSACIMIVGCHQFRIHNSSSVEIYLFCSSRPIIEDCEKLQFAPSPKNLEKGVNENLWDQIDDFKWLRTQQSPNWSILPFDKRRGEDILKVASSKHDDVEAVISSLSLA